MAWKRHAAGRVRKVDLYSLCESEGNAFSLSFWLSHKLCKETFSIAFYLSDCVADVVGGVGYGGGWGATKLSRSAKHLPLAFYHFALFYTTKLHQEKSCSSTMPVEWFYLAGMLEHLALVHPFHAAINCVGIGHVVYTSCMWDIKVWESSLPQACHPTLKPVRYHLQLARERNRYPGKLHFSQPALQTWQQSWSE